MIEDNIYIPLEISKPFRYIGNELNTYSLKGKNCIRVALCYPDTYEIGISCYAINLLYNMLNSYSEIYCDLCFAPWTDYEKYLVENNKPLTSLGSNIRLCDFDIVGFSLQHELCYTNVLTMLSLGNIPLHSRDRQDSDPLIIAGGPCAYNPEPMADFIDAYFIGEADEQICDLTVKIGKLKSNNASRRELLKILANTSGIYVPQFYEPQYEGAELIAYNKIDDVSDLPINKNYVAYISSKILPKSQITPISRVVHDRVTIEIKRGCARGCRFCHAGMISRPVREQTCETILEHCSDLLDCTGYNEISLLSLSSGDHTQIKDIIKQVLKKYSSSRVSISLPSLRLDDLESELPKLLATVRKAGFTFAPEAGTDRLRNVINKNISNEEIYKTIRNVYSAGWNLIKLYFMIGLPTETEEDLKGIADIANSVAEIGFSIRGNKAKAQVSIAPFVPKPHTPFQWASQDDVSVLREKIQYISRLINKRRCNVSYHNPIKSFLESVMARGDRKLGKVIEDAWRNGARFDNWEDKFSEKLWKESFTRFNIDSMQYANRQRDINEYFPWDVVSPLVSKDYLVNEYNKSKMGISTLDCSLTKCNQCGLHKFGCQHILTSPISSPDNIIENNIYVLDENTPIKTYRITYNKIGSLKYISHLDMIRLIEIIFRRAKIELEYSKGFNPHPILQFSHPLPIGVEGKNEILDIKLAKDYDCALLLQKLNASSVKGLDFIAVNRIDEKTTSPTRLTNKFEYKIEIKSENPSQYLDILDKNNIDYEYIQSACSSGSLPEDILHFNFIVEPIEGNLPNPYKLLRELFIKLPEKLNITRTTIK